jgi:hypothetical protein
MAHREYRCGTSNAVFQAARVVSPTKRDATTPRLRVPLHFLRGTTGGLAFRVVARLENGTQVLVCLGATREEVVRRAWSLARKQPAAVVELSLQQWVGGACAGHWLRLPARAGELPRRQRGVLRQSMRRSAWMRDTPCVVAGWRT